MEMIIRNLPQDEIYMVYWHMKKDLQFVDVVLCSEMVFAGTFLKWTVTICDFPSNCACEGRDAIDYAPEKLKKKKKEACGEAQVQKNET